MDEEIDLLDDIFSRDAEDNATEESKGIPSDGVTSVLRRGRSTENDESSGRPEKRRKVDAADADTAAPAQRPQAGTLHSERDRPRETMQAQVRPIHPLPPRPSGDGRTTRDLDRTSNPEAKHKEHPNSPNTRQRSRSPRRGESDSMEPELPPTSKKAEPYRSAERRAPESLDGRNRLSVGRASSGNVTALLRDRQDFAMDSVRDRQAEETLKEPQQDDDFKRFRAAPTLPHEDSRSLVSRFERERSPSIPTANLAETGRAGGGAPASSTSHDGLKPPEASEVHGQSNSGKPSSAADLHGNALMRVAGGLQRSNSDRNVNFPPGDATRAEMTVPSNPPDEGSKWDEQKGVSMEAENLSEKTENTAPQSGVRLPAVEKGSGQSRYFVLRSNNFDNLHISREKGVWATLNRNANVLHRAFEHSQRVVLFFSVNESRHFQGYAEMTTNVGGASNVETPWARMSNLCPNFGVKWLKIKELNFDKVSQLKNPLNENKPIRSSRDGQELTADVARILIEAFEDQGVPPGTSLKLVEEEPKAERRFSGSATRSAYERPRPPRSSRPSGRSGGPPARAMQREDSRYRSPRTDWDRAPPQPDYYETHPVPGAPHGPGPNGNRYSYSQGYPPQGYPPRF